MPKKLDKCVQKLKSQGKSESSAWAICKSGTKKRKSKRKNKK
jgi:hypothetical protein